MLQFLHKGLTNLPVGRKLILAFGLVSLLSLGAIAVALQSAGLLLSGNRQSQAIAEINLLLLHARSAEKEFALTAEQAQAEQVRQTLTAFDTRAATLEQDGDLTRLQSIRSSGQDYLRQFERFVADTQQAVQALSDMQEQAEEARIQFEFVELDMFSALREAMNGQGDMSADTLTFAENAAALQRILLAIRNRESAYIQSADKQRQAEWESLMQGAEGEVSRLQARIGEEHEDILQAAQQALANYRAAFEHYSSSRSANQRSATHMQQLADSVLQQADQTLAEHRLWLEEQASAIMRLLVVSAIMILVLALLAGWVIRQLILPPLHQALALARRIAAGDLSQDIVTERRDELGQLCQAMGTMTLNLRELVQRIVLGIEQLHRAVGSLQESSRQSSEGARAQQRETEQAATATQQMAYSAEAVSRHAEQASEAAVQANQQANAGDRVVRQSADQIGRLATDVETSMQTIRQLHQGSERIGGVLDVIKAVAEQTNLLALNAAIEAARAGEQGRGFAVVADEVRALARRTQDSTREIEALIAGLQDMSERAVQQMAGSALLSQEAVAHGEQARNALTRITGAVSSIEQFNQQIATAAEEQSAVAGEISHNVERVRNIAEQGAEANARMAGSSAELARLGGELQQLVQQFRI